MPLQVLLCAILVTAVRTGVNLESPGNRRRVDYTFICLKFLLMQNLLVPLQIEDFAAALVAFHNTSLVDLSHVQVKGTTVAESHRVTSGTFERPYRDNNLISCLLNQMPTCIAVDINAFLSSLSLIFLWLLHSQLLLIIKRLMSTELDN